MPGFLIAIIHAGVVVVLLGSSGDAPILVVETMREIEFSKALIVVLRKGEGFVGVGFGIGVNLAVLLS